MVYHRGPLVKWPKTPASHAGNSGSNPLRVTIKFSSNMSNACSHILVGVDDVEGPPVPIPNTVVKLNSAENTWLEAAREDRSTPTFLLKHHLRKQMLNIPYSIAQSGEAPKRVRWTKQRGAEVKKQGVSRSEPTSETTMFLRGEHAAVFQNNLICLNSSVGRARGC